MIENKALKLLDWAFFTPIKVVRKIWGQEIWIINNEKYCLKYMEIKPNFKCSVHRHFDKDETFIVQEGWLEVKTKPSGETKWQTQVMLPGDSLRLLPETWHVFSNLSGDVVKFLEISTTHDDLDVERWEESGYVESHPNELG